jgi:transposase InsO family protein
VNTHKNARLTPAGRLAVLNRWATGEPVAQLAAHVNVSVRTLYKWRARWRAAGAAGLIDRTSRPHRCARALPARTVQRVVQARAQRCSSLQIAAQCALPISPVVTLLRRLGLHRVPPLQPRGPIVRSEHPTPGALVHLDIKKLGKIGQIGHRITGDRTTRVVGIGWEFVHVAIDDCTRLAYAEVLADEQGETAAGFLHRAAAWFRAQGVRIRRILSDNGSCYRSRVHAAVTRALRIRHRFTRPYRPQTNGKAERWIRTLLTEWAYVRPYHTSRWRTRALTPYLSYYNTQRKHTALGFTTPAQRLAARL